MNDDFDFDIDEDEYYYFADGEDYEEDADANHGFQPLTWEDHDQIDEDELENMLEEFGF